MGRTAPPDRSIREMPSPAAETAFDRRSKGMINGFANVARAVQRIVILGWEMRGLRPSRRGAFPNPNTAGRPVAPLTVLHGQGMAEDVEQRMGQRMEKPRRAWVWPRIGVEAPSPHHAWCGDDGCGGTAGLWSRSRGCAVRAWSRMWSIAWGSAWKSRGTPGFSHGSAGRPLPSPRMVMVSSTMRAVDGC
jgi:hypothetical protein